MAAATSAISSYSSSASTLQFLRSRDLGFPSAAASSSCLALVSRYAATSSSACLGSKRKFGLASCPASQKHYRRVVESVPAAAKACSEPGETVTEYEDGEALEKRIQEAGDKLIVLDISTKTCGPCKFIYPKVVKLSIDYPDAIFLKINGDHNSSTRALMKKWGIRAVPNFRFFRNGKLIHSHTGANEDELRAYFLTHYETISV
ncbi:hypothetical protein O6H91_Y195400 [Diphasiastrum complanatum]|nr:hypothetical protein O6H91_Y195400 [Diphasiastrum complanatum]